MTKKRKSSKKRGSPRRISSGVTDRKIAALIRTLLFLFPGAVKYLGVGKRQDSTKDARVRGKPHKSRSGSKRKGNPSALGKATIKNSKLTKATKLKIIAKLQIPAGEKASLRARA